MCFSSFFLIFHFVELSAHQLSIATMMIVCEMQAGPDRVLFSLSSFTMCAPLLPLALFLFSVFSSRIRKKRELKLDSTMSTNADSTEKFNSLSINIERSSTFSVFFHIFLIINHFFKFVPFCVREQRKYNKMCENVT